MSDMKIIRLSGFEIVEALKPELRRRLGEDERHYEIVVTRWDTRPLPATRRGDKPLPPGTAPMTVDVEFTLERRAEREAS